MLTYATVTLSGASTYLWTNSTSDPRALQKATSTTDRFAATWYSPSQFVIDVNVSDGQMHKISPYAMDWDQGSRSETVSVLNASAGAVLDTRSLSSLYVSWTVSGHVQLQVTTTAAAVAVVEAVFFD